MKETFGEVLNKRKSKYDCVSCLSTDNCSSNNTTLPQKRIDKILYLIEIALIKKILFTLLEMRNLVFFHFDESSLLYFMVLSEGL